MFKKALFIPVLLLMISQVSAQIENPETVNYLRAEIIKSGHVYIIKDDLSGLAKNLNITLSIPQNTERQSRTIKSVLGPTTTA